MRKGGGADRVSLSGIRLLPAAALLPELNGQSRCPQVAVIPSEDSSFFLGFRIQEIFSQQNQCARRFILTFGGLILTFGGPHFRDIHTLT